MGPLTLANTVCWCYLHLLSVLFVGHDSFALFDSVPDITLFNKTGIEIPKNTSYDLTSPVIAPGSYRLSFRYIIPATSEFDVTVIDAYGKEKLLWTGHGRIRSWTFASGINLTEAYPFSVSYSIFNITCIEFLIFILNIYVVFTYINLYFCCLFFS